MEFGSIHNHENAVFYLAFFLPGSCELSRFTITRGLSTAADRTSKASGVVHSVWKVLQNSDRLNVKAVTQFVSNFLYRSDHEQITLCRLVCKVMLASY